MKNLKQHSVLIMAALAFAISSCHKDKNVSPSPIVQPGMYVLNQGIFNDNNSTLTYDSQSTGIAITDVFSGVNNRYLGDTGNDIEIYGGKMYIVVNVTSTIEVVNPSTAKSIKQIKMFTGTTAREPRDIVFYKGNAYITSYDGTVAVLDTATLTITNNITVGPDPEELTVANGKIYVANSGGLNYPNYGNTVSVIDPATNTVTKTLTVVINPVDVTSDAAGHVYVLSEGDYGVTTPSSLAVIDDNTDVVSAQNNFDATNMTVVGTNGYFITSGGQIGVFNTTTQTVSSTSFVTDGTTFTAPYSLTADASTGEVFVCDDEDYISNGTVYAFNKLGKLEYSFIAGINPGRIALFK